MTVENTVPVLPVSDLRRSIRFYTEKLGFTLDWSGTIVGGVSRDGHAIMLWEESRPPTPTRVWIGLQNHSLFDEYRSRGVKIHQEPRNEVWAYEMKFEDPDGNILWLGTETRKDLPLDG